jgi:hypothetical protein
VHANSRRRRNHIRSLNDNGELLLSEECKADAIFRYFNEVLDTSPSRSNSVNLDLLDLPCLNPSGLSDKFSKGKV